MVDQVGCDLRHPAAQARWAERSALARKGDESALRTRLAREQRKTSAQKAAVDVGLELAAHERRERRREALLDRRVQRLQVLTDEPVQRAELGSAPLVDVALAAGGSGPEGLRVSAACAGHGSDA